MKEIPLSDQLCKRVESIYQEMEDAYDRVSEELDFGCGGCPDNCCDSYFLHHTYLEWAYLWLGFKKLPKERQTEILHKAESYVRACEEAIGREERPQVMCPLNGEGLCTLYKHRLMVCRTHGVPSEMVRPDGKRFSFPGCFRCQEIVERTCKENPPRFDRTRLLQQLVALENELMEGKRHLYPKVRLTIAEMLVKGPPTIPTPHCEK